MMKCCVRCFDDKYLKELFIPILSEEKGDCSYCKSANQPLISPDWLKEEFELLAGIYVPDARGRPLLDWFIEDWLIFDEELFSLPDLQKLIVAIFEDESVSTERYIRSEIRMTDTLESWNNIRDELKYENRFFPELELDLDRIRELLSHVQITLGDKELRQEWYRARVQETQRVFEPSEMGAPPVSSATHGRANPAGIRYLYLASTLSTAIAEIRPHPGQYVSVGEFSLPLTLSLVDLRQPRKTVSPFNLPSETAVAQLLGDISFLEDLGQELTKPVVPHATAIDYIPSQYLCEFVKRCGYDGVLYNSSVNIGCNVALFSPDIYRASGISSHFITKVNVDFE